MYLVTERKPPPDEPPSLDAMVRMVAGLGGFLNRKRDAASPVLRQYGSAYNARQISCSPSMPNGA